MNKEQKKTLENIAEYIKETEDLIKRTNELFPDTELSKLTNNLQKTLDKQKALLQRVNSQ